MLVYWERTNGFSTDRTDLFYFLIKLVLPDWWWTSHLALHHFTITRNLQFRPSNPFFRWLPMSADVPMNYHDNNKMITPLPNEDPRHVDMLEEWHHPVSQDPWTPPPPISPPMGRFADSADLSSLRLGAQDPLPLKTLPMADSADSADLRGLWGP